MAYSISQTDPLPTVKPERIIGETLRRATDEIDTSDAAEIAALKSNVENGAADVPRAFDQFIKYPLARWIETTLGLTRDDEGNLARATPRRIRGKGSASEELAELLGTDDTDALRMVPNLAPEGPLGGPSPTVPAAILPTA